MENTITLRTMEEQDIPFSAKVYADSRAEEMEPSGWSQNEIDGFLAQQFEFQHKQYTEHYQGADFYIIVVDNQDVGRLYVNRTSSEIRIMDIAVLRPWRKRGIGGYLLNQLIEESDKKQLLLSLHVEHNNPIRPYYEHLGFVKDGLHGIYYYMERMPNS